MKSELQKKLFEKYPKIFRQKDLSMQVTCMCWGIDTGDGWYWLIDNLCKALQGYTDRNTHIPVPQVEATQVKEKFGGLRFYTGGGDNEQRGMIRLAESMSYNICENCGSTENVTQNDKGWIQSLCPKCRK